MASTIKGIISEQDLNRWDGVTGTFTRLSSTGETLTLRKVGTEVDALQSYGGGVNFTDTTIISALTAIGTTNVVTLMLRPGTWVISANRDWSAYTNIIFHIMPGALISHGAFTLNIPNVKAGLYSWLSGTGTITFSGKVKEICPDWWTDNLIPKTTDMTTAVQSAITSGIINNTPVAIHSMMLLTASVNIDRLVDSAAYDEYFEIKSHSGGGFYVATAINMFSSSIAFTTAPVTQLSIFDHIYFESNAAATAAYVLADARFLRTQFNFCSFSKIKCLTATIYTQSIYFKHCNMRRWTGIFYNSPIISFDIKFHGCLAEAGEDFAVVHAAVGTSFIGTTIEGLSGTAIEYNQAQGFSVVGCYFEKNDKDIEDAVEGAESSWGVAILGNMFSHTPAGGYAPSSDYSVIWALGEGNVSKGNYFSYKGHYLLATSKVDIDDYAVTALANVSTKAMFLARPTADQDDIAINSDVTVVFGTEIFDVGSCFAANTFTAPITGKYQFSVSLELHEVDSAATTYTLTLFTSNRNYIIAQSGTMLAADGALGHIGLSVLADMDVTDTAHVAIYQTAGTQQTDISTNSYFSGYLVSR